MIDFINSLTPEDIGGLMTAMLLLVVFAIVGMLGKLKGSR